MKKLFIAASLLIGMIAGAMVLSSFTAPKQGLNEKCEQVGTNVPTYWEGCVHRYDHPMAYVYIKVYQTEGMCNSFYAVLIGSRSSDSVKDGDEVYVKNNPNYDPDHMPHQLNKSKYLITYHGHDYFFDM